MRRSDASLSSAPSLKRSISALTENSHDGEEGRSRYEFHLRSQNQAMVKEIKKCRLKILKLQTSIEEIAKKNNNQDSLVSLITRTWNQLDSDISHMSSQLLVENSTSSSSSVSSLQELLKIYLDSKFANDPSDTSDIGDMNIDEWSSPEAIQKAKDEALAKITIENTSLLHGASCLEESIQAHISGTRQHYETLLQHLVSSHNLEHATSLLHNLIDARQFESERIMLATRIVHLAHEIVELKVQLHRLRTENTRYEKRFNTLLENGAVDLIAAHAGPVGDDQPPVPTSSSAASVVLDLGPGGSDAPPLMPSALQRAASTSTSIQSVHTAHSNHSQSLASSHKLALPVEEEDSSQQITQLERLLAESEAARAKLEVDLLHATDSRSTAEREALRELEGVLDGLRGQCKAQNDAAATEIAALQERVSQLEASSRALSGYTEERCSSLVTDTQALVDAAKAERDECRAALSVARAELQQTQKLKAQISELETLEAAARAKTSKLKEKVARFGIMQAALNESLTRVRLREEALERELAGHIAAPGKASTRILESEVHAPRDSNDMATTTSSSSSSNHINDNRGQDQLQELFISVERKFLETQTELVETRASMNELFLEIESVSAEEAAAREKSAQLLRQSNESIALHQGALEEINRLTDALEEQKTTYLELKRKADGHEQLFKSQDTLLQQYRQADAQLRSELDRLHKSMQRAQRVIQEQEVQLTSLHAQVEKDSVFLLEERRVKRELQKKCEEATAALAGERKARMDLQKETKKKVKQQAMEYLHEKKAHSSALSTEDTAMLDMTLSMLRCSVCRDRFKQVALTRCCHMFCKECIDENIKNRQRKCPACGDKFGQDDVKTIYFTH